MPITKRPYLAPFRQQMIELVQAGRKPGDLAKEFGCHMTSILNWVRKAQPTTTTASGDAGELSASERQELMELRRLSGLSVSIQEKERRRIALDLHDGLGQSLSLIKLLIENCARLLAAGAIDEARESLQQLIPRMKDALVDVRRVSIDLRPSILDDLGILPTLAWFLRDYESACASIDMEKMFNVAEHEVPVPLHIPLYRILQEAIHNIVKHAAADRVRVRLDRIDDVLILLIEDNGRGFNPDSIGWDKGNTRGLGLLSMKQRASLSGGAYHLRSAPGQGTGIWVSWPCRQFLG